LAVILWLLIRAVSVLSSPSLDQFSISKRMKMRRKMKMKMKMKT